MQKKEGTQRRQKVLRSGHYVYHTKRPRNTSLDTPDVSYWELAGKIYYRRQIGLQFLSFKRGVKTVESSSLLTILAKFKRF